MHLNLQEKTFLIFTQQFNGFVGLCARVGTLSLRCGLGVQVTAACRYCRGTLLSVLASALAYCVSKQS